MYRPGTGVIWIVKNYGNNTFSPVYGSGTGIGGYDLKSSTDQIIAFDYDSSGKQNYLLLYRPGTGVIWIVKNYGNNTFSPVYNSGTGIGGYDLKSSADQIIAFDYDGSGKDYDGSGKLDHLVLYRPGIGLIFIVQENSGNTFSASYATPPDAFFRAYPSKEYIYLSGKAIAIENR